MKKRIMQVAVVLTMTFIFYVYFSKESQWIGKLHLVETRPVSAAGESALEHLKEAKETEEKVKAEKEEKKLALLQMNEERFWIMGNKQEVATEELERCYKKLLEDDVFRDGTRELTACIIRDLDENGQNDMIAVVADEMDWTGSVYIYFNEEATYCYNNEEMCYCWGFYEDVLAADIDNDGNLELVITLSNGGCGGSGGKEAVFLKRKNHTFEEMHNIPCDGEEKYDKELNISVTLGMKENCYSAYCPYLDETIEFQSQNANGTVEEEFGKAGGANSRGFYNFQCVKYEGKNALQCTEYLFGEGGIAHCVGWATFVIAWDEDGNSRIADWWIEER